MKRQFNIAMIAVFLFMAIVSPVSAAEIDTDTWFPVLDYTTVDNSGYVFITVNQSETVSFDLFGIRACYSFDILCNITGDRSELGAQVTVNGRTFDLEVLHIGDYLYRLYGNVGGGLADTEVELTITCPTTCYVTFYQFDVLSVKHSSFDETGRFAVLDYNGASSFQVMTTPGTSVSYSLGTVNSGTVDNNFQPYGYLAYIYPDNWRKYEYIDIFFTVQALSIDSLECHVGDIALPYQISYMDLDSSDWVSSGYDGAGVTKDFQTEWSEDGTFDITALSRTVTVYIRLYVKDLDPDSSETPGITIRGQYVNHPSGTDYITLNSVKGHVQTDDINPLHYYFQDLYRKLGNWFGKLTDALNGDTAPGEDFQDELAPEIDQIQQDQAILDSVDKPYIGNFQINDWSQIVQGTNVFSVVLTSIMGSQSLTMIIGVSVSCMLVAYLIFGKR